MTEEKSKRWLELLLQGVALFIAIVIPIVSASQAKFEDLSDRIDRIDKNMSYIFEPKEGSVRLQPEYYVLKKEIALIQRKLDEHDKNLDTINMILRDYFIDRKMRK